jgi:hypothetical protein
MIVEKRTMRAVTLKRPYLSAIMLGRVRPMKLFDLKLVVLIVQRKGNIMGERKREYLAPLRMGIKLNAVETDMPSWMAEMTM